MQLPHRYPFQLVDRVLDERVVIRLTLGARHVAPDGELPQTLMIELLAQACFYLVPQQDGDGGQLALAGIENAQFSERLSAGDEVEARGELVARFGPLVRVHGVLTANGAKALEADLLLASAKRPKENKN